VKILRNEPGTNAIIACTGDLIDIPAGFFASRITNLPFIAYLFDDYVYQWLGIHRVFAKFIAPIIFKHAEGVIGPNEFICEEYRKRYGIETTLVRNPYAEECLSENEKNEWPIEVGKIKIIYTGAIYHANYDCFLNLIQSLHYLSKYDLELHIFTSQPAETLEAYRINGMNVFIHTHIPYQEIIQQQQKADILFLPLTFESDISEVIRTSAPGKMGEYLLSGRPVLAHVPPDSFVANFFREYQSGWLVDHNDPMELAFEIEKIILQKTHRDIITESAKQVAKSEFSPQVARCQFIQQITKSSDCIPSQMLKIDEEE
jgi:glycosyltransferase involved in cell wall biosynthesis